MTGMNEINKQINIELEGIKFMTLNSVGVYNIKNTDGEVYSRFKGWQKLDGKLYGHQFHKAEIPLVKAILKAHGYEAVETKRDTVGSLFMLSLKSPFAHPVKFMWLLVFTAIFFFAYYLAAHTELPYLLIDHLEESNISK